MSRKLDDVLEIIWGLAQWDGLSDVAQLRRARASIVSGIAKSRGVDRNTVADSYVRRLAPQANGTADFDRLVLTWLTESSAELQRVLEEHAKNGEALERVRSFFARRRL